jgi:hypothetical protein
MSTFALGAASELLVGLAWAMVLAGGTVWASLTPEQEPEI